MLEVVHLDNLNHPPELSASSRGLSGDFQKLFDLKQKASLCFDKHVGFFIRIRGYFCFSDVDYFCPVDEFEE